MLLSIYDIHVQIYVLAHGCGNIEGSILRASAVTDPHSSVCKMCIWCGRSGSILGQKIFFLLLSLLSWFPFFTLYDKGFVTVQFRFSILLITWITAVRDAELLRRHRITPPMQTLKQNNCAINQSWVPEMCMMK